ncbi:MAG: killer suppression protein [Planctomycetes bacterium]|nr:killer suppression protein [Planctomycetota bacterium]
MVISFDTEKLKKLCNDTKALIKAFGAVCAKKIRRRLDDMGAAATLEVCRSLPGQYHELKGDRKWQVAVHVEEPRRLVFFPAHDPIPTKKDGGLDWNLVTAVRVLAIEDYHG